MAKGPGNARRFLPLVLLAALLPGCRGETAAAPEGPCDRVSTAALEMPPSAAVLAQRRASLAEPRTDGVVLVLAAGVDNPNPRDNGYRDDGDLYYLTGLDVPGSWLILVMRNHRVESATLYLPDNPTGPTTRASTVTGIATVRCASAFATDLRGVVAASNVVLQLQWENPARLDPVVSEINALWGGRPYVNGLYPRTVKDASEIERLRTAVDITSRSIAESAALVRAGSTEGDVAAAMLARFAAHGTPRAGFPSIIASGPSALEAHYGGRTRALAGGELVVIDVGAEYGRYTGDVTRTFPVDGVFSPRQRALYELVLGAQQTVIDSIRPGVTFGRLDSIARAYLHAHSGTLCGIRPCEEYDRYYVGHSLGLNVHDVGMWTLAPGMVLTVEPSIRMPADSLGVQIEDDVLVTATGHELLSGAAPRTVEGVEALLASVRGRSLRR